jgi:hypothetical protein
MEPLEQKKLVGNVTDTFVHLKRPVELRTQFAPTSDIERGDRAMKEAQLDPIPGMKFELLVIAIVL